MPLTRVERWILANQYRILEALSPNEAEGMRGMREVLEEGFELEYAPAGTDRDVVSEEECREILAILDMHVALKLSYEELEDRGTLDEDAVRFRGFEGESEAKQLSYVRYLDKMGRYRDLEGLQDLESPVPVLSRYRAMLAEYGRAPDHDYLTREDIIRITAVR